MNIKKELGLKIKKKIRQKKGLTQAVRNTKAANIKGGRILKYGKAGKLLGRLAAPLAVAGYLGGEKLMGKVMSWFD